MRRAAVGVMVAVLASSCFGGSTSGGGAEELAEIATRVTDATYAAIYRYSISGPLAPGVRTRLEIVQQPPVFVRKLDHATADRSGKVITVRSWQVRNANGNYLCTDYPNVGTRCVQNPIARGTFGSAQIDDFFDSPREATAFASVRKAPGTVRIRGEQGTCFEAVPMTPTPAPVSSPQPVVTPERFRYELCYAEDGILLRGPAARPRRRPGRTPARICRRGGLGLAGCGAERAAAARPRRGPRRSADLGLGRKRTWPRLN
jgi:hypothetical protein